MGYAEATEEYSDVLLRAVKDALLGELRSLEAAHPEEAAVRERLAAALFNCLNDAGDGKKPDLRRALLGELRSLASRHLEDSITGICLPRCKVAG